MSDLLRALERERDPTVAQLEREMARPWPKPWEPERKPEAPALRFTPFAGVTTARRA